MRKRSKISSRCWSATGLTLIEVLAAIAILGTVLAGVVLSKSRHTHQLALSRRKNEAVRAADRLIGGWWTGSEGVPVGKSGPIEADASLTWRTRIVPNDAIARLDARVVRVEILDAGQGENGPAPAAPVVTVDLVLPLEEDDRQEGTDGDRAGQALDARAP